MSPNEDPDIKRMIELIGQTNEIIHDNGNERLRINLRREDIRLWQAYTSGASCEANLILACESSTGMLEDTKLTWVVGAAIRATSVDGARQAMELLQRLGISRGLTEKANQCCPGLGKTLTWAFHLERHGWLTATPVES